MAKPAATSYLEVLRLKKATTMNLRNLAIWGVIVVILLGIYSAMNPSSKSGTVGEISYSQLLTKVDGGQIKSAVFRNDVVEAKDASGKGYNVVTPMNQDDLVKRLQASGADIQVKPAGGITPMGLFLNALPVLLLIAVYIFFMRQMQGGARGAMGFGKSKARLLTENKNKVTFDDVAGVDEAKEELNEIVEFLKDPGKFQKLGGKIPKGALLVGPPGTGKTLLARAIAGEAGVPFFSISGSDFVEMFVGVGASRVRDMFEQAKKNAPCIIFIDEIDAVGRQRGAGVGGGNDEREQTLNSLLVEMDGFDGQAGVIVIGATNRSDVLDSALLRPGRFDRQVFVDLPDLRGREAVLAVHAKRFQLAPSVDLQRVARITTGMSGADLANLLNEGALHAGRRNREKVEMSDIEEARDKIAYGRERKKVMDEEDRRSTAYHEAGHALVQSLIDDGSLPLHKVTILPRGRALGMAMYMPAKEILGYSKARLLNYICTAMAGRIAERVVTGEISNGASSDIKQATRMARQMVCDWGMSDLGPIAYGENSDTVFLGREISRTQNHSDATARRIDEAITAIVQEQYARAEKLIADNAEALRKIAEALLLHETLDGVHVMEIIKTGAIQTPIAGPVVAPAPAAEVAQPAPSPAADAGPGLQSSPSPA